MKRLTERHNGWVMRKGCHGPCKTCHRVECADICPMIDRLAAYEDTGLEPEGIKERLEAYKELFFERADLYNEIGSIEHIKELIQAEKDGRLVVLNEPRQPLVWGNDVHDSILCPNCNHDLMGGFPETESCETPMYQCPYCGQAIDDSTALTREEAEAALKKRKEAERGETGIGQA